MTRLLATLCFSATAVFGAARPAIAQQRWVPLGDVGHPAFIDTSATVRRSSTILEVRLRLAGYNGAGLDRVETEEVNCGTGQSRVLKAEDWPTDERDIAPGPQRVPVDSAWHRFPPSSLGGELVHAVCARFQHGAGDARPPGPGAGA